MSGLFYTVEEHRASVPVSDTDRVMAHFERNGRSGEIVVLEGGDMTVTDIRWNGPGEVTLCIRGGITTMFRNQVTVFAGETSVAVRNHLDENCSDKGHASSSSSAVQPQGGSN
jgi:hypothetical protein